MQSSLSLNNNNIKSIPFILKKEQNQSQYSSKYYVTKQASDFLKSIKTQFSVITVAGLYRTGKSYLLNRVVLNKQHGFNIGSTVNACTKGLWIWGQILTTTDHKHYLVIDTEGLGALDQQTNHDMKIICLAVLLSTTFIYNSQGSIDQNALQTLSLVLNLVGAIDRQQISQRPDLIWVVRDFALQLITQGKTITPKQYLEHALNMSNTKQTNKLQIRNTILKAFKQRDCFTLIKPLIDENKLQNLHEIAQNQIRAQFLQQCGYLRKKILNNLRPFTLNSRDLLTGNDYLKISKQYVEAINQGKVPCMMDTWTYIRQQKARQVIEQIHQKYSQKIQTKLTSKMPMTTLQLNQYLQAYSKQIMEDFYKYTYQGTSTEQIQKHIAQSQNQLRKINLQQTKSTLNTLLNKQYESYKKKVMSQFYSNYQQFKKDLMNNFKNQFLQRYRQKYDYIEEILGAYTQSKIIQGFTYFQKQLRSQIEKQKLITNQTQKRMSQQLNSITQSNNQERHKLKSTIQTLQKQNFQLTTKQRLLSNDMQKQKLFNSKATDQLQKKNEQLMNMIEKLTNDINKKNNTISQENKNMYIKEKQLQKDKALFIQKQKQMIQQINSMKQKINQSLKKEKDFCEKLQEQKKELSQRFQRQIKQYEKHNSKLQQRNSQLQINNLELQKDLDIIKDQMKNLKIKTQNDKQNLLKKIQFTEASHQSQTIAQQIKNELKKAQQKVQKLTYQNKEYEIRHKQIIDKMNNVKSSSQKQNAIHLQKIQFQQIQIKQLKERNDQLKKNYHLALENLQDSSKNLQQNYQMKMFQQKAEYQTKIKSLENDYQLKIKQAKKDVQSLNQSKEDLILQINLLKKNFQSKQKQWKQANLSLQHLYQKAQEKLISTERDHQDVYKQKQNYFKLRVKQLQQELQDVKQKSCHQIDQNQAKSQEAIALLKKYSEMEKLNFQKRLNDEKQKSQKRLKALNEQFEQKMTEQKQNYEQQISDLQQKIQQRQKFFDEKIQNLRCDYQINLQQTIKKFMDQKVQITKNNALLEQQLSITKKNMQKQLQETKFILNKQKQSMKKALTINFQQNYSRLKDDKQILQKKYQQLKKSNKQTSQKNILLKNQLDNQKALFKEKIKNLQFKIFQCQNKLKSQIQSFNITIENITQTNENQRNRLNRQIQNLSFQYNQINRQKNQLQNNYQTDKQMKETKISYLQMSLKRTKQDYEDILNKFQKTVQHLTKDKDNSRRQQSKNQSIIAKIKADCDQQMQIKQEQRMSIIRDYQERLQIVKNQNKNLKDKILGLQIRPNNQQRITKNYENQIEKIKEKHHRQKQDYEKIITNLQDALKKQKKQNHKLRQGYQYRSKQVQMLRQQDRSFLQQSQIIYRGNQNQNQNQNNYPNIYGQQKSQRHSISTYNGNPRHSTSTRQLLSDNKNIHNISINAGRKSSQTVLQSSNSVNKKYSNGPRVIENQDEYTGIKRYSNVNSRK